MLSVVPQQIKNCCFCSCMNTKLHKWIRCFAQSCCCYNVLKLRAIREEKLVLLIFSAASTDFAQPVTVTTSALPLYCSVCDNESFDKVDKIYFNSQWFMVSKERRYNSFLGIYCCIHFFLGETSIMAF